MKNNQTKLLKLPKSKKYFDYYDLEFWFEENFDSEISKLFQRFFENISIPENGTLVTFNWEDSIKCCSKLQEICKQYLPKSVKIYYWR